MNKITIFKTIWFTIAAAIMLTMIITSCDGTQKAIRGKWTIEREDDSFTIYFKLDNEVDFIISNYFGEDSSVTEEVVASGKYSITDNKIEFELSGNSSEIEFSNMTVDYKINGDTLILVSEGESREFVKMK